MVAHSFQTTEYSSLIDICISHGVSFEMAVATRNTAAPANGPIVIPAGGKECLRATGYRRNIYKTFIFHCLSVILLGLPYALVYWHAVFGIQWKYTKVLNFWRNIFF